MEHLIDLIRREFELAQYHPIDENGLLWQHEDFNDFWVICEMEDEYQLEELQERIYSDLATLRKSLPESEKSTSLLILHHLNNDSGKNLQQVIESENNVYYFKKYIIQYTSDEWMAAKGLLPENHQGLGHVLMQPNVFEQIRASENSPCRLLYTVAHKLPFVMMKVERQEYNPNPIFNIKADLQPVFEWVEAFPDMTGRTPKDNEIQAANAAIENWINVEENE